MSYPALRSEGDVVQLFRTMRYLSLHQGTRPAPATRPEVTARSRARAELAALRADWTVNQTAAQHRVHPSEVRPWRESARDGSAAVFERRAVQARHGDTG